MRNWSWLLLVAALGCRQTEPGEKDPTDTGTPTVPTATDTGETTPVTKPCDPLDGLAVTDAAVTQPWTEHEAQIAVTLTDPAAIAVACQLDSDPAEVHLVEGATERASHTLRIAGLLASSTYHCSVAPVCPSTSEPVYTVDLKTGPELEDRLPTIELITKDAAASPDYILTNHQQAGSWNGQRRIVIDRDANVRWRAARNAAGGAGGPAVNFNKARETFTIGGGWPPNANGRPQQLDMFGSDVLYDTRDHLKAGPDLVGYHHDGRQLADGRFLTLEQITVDRQGGGTFEGFGFRILDPTDDSVDLEWTSQGAYDAGHIPAGNGDAYHTNWINVIDGVVHVSMCYQGAVAAIDATTGDWLWLFGKNGDWSLVDTDGNALPDSEYSQCQHGLKREGDRLLIYDNGMQRGYTRAVEFQLDETNMVATKLWEYSEPNWFETALGGVDYTTRGNVLIAMGHTEELTPTPGDHTTFVELDPTTMTKLWEIRYGAISDMAYRAETIPPCDMFGNAKYCDETATRLQALASVLGVTR